MTTFVPVNNKVNTVLKPIKLGLTLKMQMVIKRKLKLIDITSILTT